jgi:energy-coupling factor transport system permease protein
MANSRMKYTQGDSFFHRRNPLLKLLTLIVVTIAVIIYPSWRFGMILFLFILIFFTIARIPLRITKGRIRYLILFSIFLLLLQVLATSNGTILAFLIPQLGEFGPYFPVTDFGVERGLAIAVRFLVIVFSSMLFISITDPTLLAHSLTRLGIPYKYSFALVITLRFIPLFDSEMNSVRMAQQSRGISAEVGGLSKILRTIRYTFFPLLVSALSWVDTLSLSMEGRGFGYAENRTYLRKSNWDYLDSVSLVLLFCFLIFIILLTLGYLPQVSQYI